MVRIQRTSVLEQRSGWVAADKTFQFEAGDCEVSYAKPGASGLDHLHEHLRIAAPPPGFERPNDRSWKCSLPGIVELHYREPSSLPGHDATMFDTKSLDGWHLIGDASFAVDDGGILGRTSTGKSNSFLVTNDTYGDFLLTLEVKNEGPGNSGIQIRSRVVGSDPKTSYATGYQIEIDPSARAWSGGFYEERGRGWLQNLEKNEAGRKAFRPGEWNRYRIECVGPWIRAWVNDVPTADALDPEALEGIIGLQVHSGQDTKVRFRRFKMHSFGKHAWSALDAKRFATEGAELGNDFGLRITRTAQSSLAGCQIRFRGDRKWATPPRGNKGDLLQTGNSHWSISLDDPRLSSGEWKELVLLAYSDRLALFLDHKQAFESRAFCGSDGPWVWIERPAGAGETPPFERIESLEPARR